ncbi:MAG: hypothetical protein M1814_005405 [Vezdaea aestivalis]|nr:MAG: hypothetical protein M1814_005405 [Vezdaea aestivalis]
MVAMSVNGPSNVPARNVPPVSENGRLYHGYLKGMYMYPCDEQEKDRMDILHKFFQVARRDFLHAAPISAPSNGERLEILDLGTGTGIWAMDMAEKYPNSWIVGLDLSNIQPERIPRNVRFRIQDYEGPWTFGEGSKDLIHLRMGAGSVSSWPELYQKVFDHLKPGSGYFEQVEIDYNPKCSDGSMPSRSMLKEWYDYMAQATERASRPIAYDGTTRQMLESAGFTDINRIVIKVPLNAWSSNPLEKDIGRWWNLAMTDGLGLEALSLGPLTRVNKWPVDSVNGLVRDAKREMCTKKFHIYNEMFAFSSS